MSARVIQVPHTNYAYVIFEPDTSADDDITQEQSIILKFDDYTKELLTRITELEADALARLIEEPTNERIMKDVYEENERLQKAVDGASAMFSFISDCGADSPVIRVSVDKWLKEYGKERT